MILEFSLREQLFCCAVSALVGVFYGISYDTVRVVYMIAGIDPHEKKKTSVISNTLVAFVDLVFMVAVSTVFAVVMYAFAYGKFRFIFGICALAGFLGYNRTLSKIVIFLLRKLIAAIKTSIRFILRLILYPIKLIIKYISALAYFVYSVTFKILISLVKTRLDTLLFNKICENSIDELIKFEDVSIDDINYKMMRKV